MNTIDMKLVKRHISNLMNGHGIGKDELKSLYKEVLRESIKRKIDSMFAAHNLDVLIQQTVKNVALAHVKDLLRKEHYGRPTTSTSIERMIQDECNKQIREIIRENFKVTLADVPQFQEPPCQQ